ncbi:hypothetical protein [Acetobacter sp.]|uniref:hypothetical protein n=1 Tax=Acetobacter sp. TaxID=440 RepID=UPI0039ED34C5
MKTHNATSTPAPAACQPDVVRNSMHKRGLSFKVRLYGVAGCASAFRLISQIFASAKRLPGAAWLLAPYRQQVLEKTATEWQNILNENWPVYRNALQRLHRADLRHAAPPENPPCVKIILLERFGR